MIESGRSGNFPSSMGVGGCFTGLDRLKVASARAMALMRCRLIKRRYIVELAVFRTRTTSRRFDAS